MIGLASIPPAVARAAQRGVLWASRGKSGRGGDAGDAHSGTRGTPTPGRGGDAGDAHTGTCTGRVGTRTGRVRDAYDFYHDFAPKFFGRSKQIFLGEKRCGILRK